MERAGQKKTGRPRVHTAPKPCKNPGCPMIFHRRHKEAPVDYNRRETCCPKCGLNLKRHRYAQRFAAIKAAAERQADNSHNVQWRTLTPAEIQAIQHTITPISEINIRKPYVPLAAGIYGLNFEYGLDINDANFSEDAEFDMYT